MANDIANSGSADHELPPRILRRPERRRRVMQFAYQLRYTCQLVVGMGGAAALDEAEDLAALFVDSDRARGSCEPDSLEVSEQRVNSRRPATPGASHGLADMPDLGQPAPPTETGTTPRVCIRAHPFDDNP